MKEFKKHAFSSLPVLEAQLRRLSVVQLFNPSENGEYLIEICAPSKSKFILFNLEISSAVSYALHASKVHLTKASG